MHLFLTLVACSGGLLPVCGRGPRVHGALLCGPGGRSWSLCQALLQERCLSIARSIAKGAGERLSLRISAASWSRQRFHYGWLVCDGAAVQHSAAVLAGRAGALHGGLRSMLSLRISTKCLVEGGACCPKVATLLVKERAVSLLQISQPGGCSGNTTSMRSRFRRRNFSSSSS